MGMAISNTVRQIAEQLQPGRCNSDFNNTPIFGEPFPLHQPPGFEPVEQAGHIGCPGDETSPEFGSPQALGGFRPQQPQGIVLLSRKIVTCKDLLFELLQQVVCSPEIKERSLLSRIEPPL